MPVIAKGRLGDHDIEAEVLNPGDWWGKVWLIEIGGSYCPIYFAVEADSMQSALDEFADSDRGHHIHIDIEVEGGDYGYRVQSGDIMFGRAIDFDGWLNLRGERSEEELLEPACLGNAGTPCDLDHIWVHGQEGAKVPWPCTYHDAADPLCDGIPPETYADREEETDD